MRPDVLEIAIVPRSKADHEKLGVTLKRLAAKDPTFRATTDQESGQTIISGTSELHLDRLIERVRRELEFELDVGGPQIAYRESLASAVEVDYTHKNQSGGSGQFGRVKVRLAPGKCGSGVRFFDEIKGGNIPREYIPSVEKGMREMAETGSLLGFPIIDFEIHLVDGAYHELDSSALAFEMTGRGAMREGAQHAGINLLEPVMNVEVVTPEDYLDDVISVLKSRGEQIRARDSRGEAQVVVTAVPLSNLFGFENELSAISDGAVAVEIKFERYAVVQPNGDDPDDTFPAAAALRA